MRTNTPADHVVAELADFVRAHGREDLLADLFDCPPVTVPAAGQPAVDSSARELDTVRHQVLREVRDSLGDQATGDDLIDRARYALEFGCGDDLHRELLDALEATRAQLITVSIRAHFMRSDKQRTVEPLYAKLRDFRALATRWGQADSSSELRAASTAILAILNRLTPDGSAPSPTASA